MSERIWELESAVGKKLGVVRGVLAEYRKTQLEKDREWRMNRNQVELSPDAIDKISTALGAAPAVTAHNPPPAVAPEAVEELEVVRVYPNPRLLLAKMGAELVLVAVPRNKNFRARMLIKARRPANGSALYTLEGRCPRFPGRW